MCEISVTVEGIYHYQKTVNIEMEPEGSFAIIMNGDILMDVVRMRLKG